MLNSAGGTHLVRYMSKGIKTEEANGECGKYYDVLYSFAKTAVKLNDMAEDGMTHKLIEKKMCRLIPAFAMLCGMEADGSIDVSKAIPKKMGRPTKEQTQEEPKPKPKTVLQVNLNTKDDWGICPTCGKKCIKVYEDTILVNYPMFCSKCQHEYIMTWKSDLARQKKESGEHMGDKQIMEAIRKIVERGNNAEVKRRKDGSLVVYEVRKHVAAQ